MNFKRGGKRGWVVQQDFLWGVGRKDDPHPVTIPGGFEFESSVPWWARWWFDPDDPDFLFPAAVHDWFLENGYRRAFADSQWYEAGLAKHSPVIKRELGFLGIVSRGRWRAFREYFTTVLTTFLKG